jgi:CheY-like chemotaxis protein
MTTQPSDLIPQSDASARILIADDSQVNRLVFASMLSSIGYASDAVSDGKEAFEAVSQKLYRLVFMDIQMPRMNGYEAAEAIRELEGDVGGVPIVAVSADFAMGSKLSWQQSGMNGRLERPVRKNELHEVLWKYFQQ